MAGKEIVADKLVIDCERTSSVIVDFIRKKVREEQKAGVCFGLSGGIDSTVLAFLTVEAVGAENVHVLYLPDRDSQGKFGGYAKEVADLLGIDFEKKNISELIKKQGVYKPLLMKLVFWPPLNKLLALLANKVIYPLVFRESGFVTTLKGGETKNAFARFVYKSVAVAIEGGFNARHIQRRLILEEYAQKHNFLLLGAANKSEGYVGWFVKDGVDDIRISPILDLYKTQVRQLAKYLSVPSPIQKVKPSPDMWKGVGDEDIIGHLYEVIDKVAYAEEHNLDGKLLREWGITRKEAEEIRRIHRLSEWKRANPHEYPKLD